MRLYNSCQQNLAANSMFVQIQIWMKQTQRTKKKSFQFNNIHVRGDGHSLFAAVRRLSFFMTIHWICICTSMVNLFIVSSCVRLDLLILYFYRSLPLVHYLLRDRFVNKNWHWCARRSCQIVFNNKEVMNFIPNIVYIWFDPFEIYMHIIMVHGNLWRSIGCCHQLFSIIARYCDVLAFNLNRAFHKTYFSFACVVSFTLLPGPVDVMLSILLNFFFKMIFKSMRYENDFRQKRRKNNEKIISRSAY